MIVSLSLARDGAALCYGAREAGRNQFRLFYTDLTTGRTTFVAEAVGRRDFPNRAQGGLSY